MNMKHQIEQGNFTEEYYCGSVEMHYDQYQQRFTSPLPKVVTVPLHSAQVSATEVVNKAPVIGTYSRVWMCGCAAIANSI